MSSDYLDEIERKIKDLELNKELIKSKIVKISEKKDDLFQKTNEIENTENCFSQHINQKIQKIKEKETQNELLQTKKTLNHLNTKEKINKMYFMKHEIKKEEIKNKNNFNFENINSFSKTSYYDLDYRFYLIGVDEKQDEVNNYYSQINTEKVLSVLND